MERKKTSEERRRADLAQIHIAKKELGMDEDDYRAFLLGVAKVESAAALDFTGRQLVLAKLRQLGWDPGKCGRSSGKKWKRPEKGSQQSKIWALWFELHREGKVRDKSAKALNAFCKRMTDVERLEWLTPEQCNVVIEGLKDWQRRDE